MLKLIITIITLLLIAYIIILIVKIVFQFKKQQNTHKLIYLIFITLSLIIAIIAAANQL